MPRYLARRVGALFPAGEGSIGGQLRRQKIAETSCFGNRHIHVYATSFSLAEKNLTSLEGKKGVS